MSVLIKGMEMPKSCDSCMFDIYGLCLINKNIEGENKLTHNCPLVPVQPHGRLGDLDKLEKMFADIDSAPYSCFDGTEPFYSAEDAAHIIKLAPTIIPAEEGE